jgi:hypothetical protein
LGTRRRNATSSINLARVLRSNDTIVSRCGHYWGAVYGSRNIAAEIGEINMKDEHNKAAEHHEAAAKSHRAAAEAHGKNDHAKGKEHSTQAQQHAENASNHSKTASSKSNQQQK